VKEILLYIIRNGPPSYVSYDYDGMSEKVAYVANFLHILQSFSRHYFYVDRNTLLGFWKGSVERRSMGVADDWDMG
jgi:hypothetical protein